MINIKIAGKEYGLPNLEEIKLHKFIEFLDFVDENEPAEDCEETNEWLGYYAKHIAFWTGADLSLVRKCKAEDIAGTYSLHRNYIAPVENKTFNCFELCGDIYYLPERFMQNSTIEDFAEANEYEKQMAEVLNGHYLALPKVAAVICRKEGEGFDDYDVEARAELFNEEMSAADLFQVGFFLQRLNLKLQTNLQIFMTSQTIAALKQE